MGLKELLVCGKDVCNDRETIVLNEMRLVELFGQFDWCSFVNLTNYYLLNCLTKIFMKTEEQKTRNAINVILGRIQNGRLKVAKIIRTKAIEIRALLSLDEEIRKEIFEEVPQGTMPSVFKG